jgi:hypothetical protein
VAAKKNRSPRVRARVSTRARARKPRRIDFVPGAGRKLKPVVVRMSMGEAFSEWRRMAALRPDDFVAPSAGGPGPDDGDIDARLLTDLMRLGKRAWRKWLKTTPLKLRKRTKRGRRYSR